MDNTAGILERVWRQIQIMKFMLARQRKLLLIPLSDVVLISVLVRHGGLDIDSIPVRNKANHISFGNPAQQRTKRSSVTDGDLFCLRIKTCASTDERDGVLRQRFGHNLGL